MAARKAGAAGARRTAEVRGRRAEWVAAWFLRLKGYRVLARRYRAPVGEIDLIVRRGKLIAFVEVKARATLVEAVESVTPAGRRRVGRAAAAWLASHPAAGFDLRFDVVALSRRRLPRHLPGAFDADGRA